MKYITARQLWNKSENPKVFVTNMRKIDYAKCEAKVQYKNNKHYLPIPNYKGKSIDGSKFKAIRAKNEIIAWEASFKDIILIILNNK